MNKILLTAILKDDSELPVVERMLQSFMPHMAGLAVAITGVSGQHERLQALIKLHGGQFVVTTPKTHPQIYAQTEKGFVFANFAEARNVSFELASAMQKTTAYDFWTWADADDMLANGEELQKIVEIAKGRNDDEVFFTYWYSVIQNADGTIRDVMIDHLRERLLKPNVFRWTSRLHEIAVPIDPAFQPKTDLYSYDPKEGRTCVWIHLTGPERVLAAMQRNIQLLEIQKREEVTAGKDDPRTTFYLAKTYYDLHDPKHDPMVELLIQDYLQKSGWAEERANAWEYLGNLRVRKGDHRGAIDAYHESLKQFGGRHMPMLLLAREYADVGDHDQSDIWLETAMRLAPPQTRTTISNPMEIKFLAASLKYNAAIRAQNLDEAIRWLTTRNQIAGLADDGMLKTLEESRAMNEAAKHVFAYAKWLKENGHEGKMSSVLESLPFELGREPFAHMIAHDYAAPRIWGAKEIAYVASWGVEHFEGWSPKNLNTGIGGSETAVINLAREWVKLGFKVTVYGDPREDEGEWEGVTYKPWYAMNWKDSFNILILWRSPHLLDREIKARKIFMDLHDVASQLDWTEKRMEKVDKVFFKSTYHRAMLPKLPDDKVAIVSNGI